MMNRGRTEPNSRARAATLVICGLMLAVWVAAAPSALAHYGDHTVGVMKVNSP
jgi:hypothetical protein